MGSEMNPHDNADSPVVLLRRLHRWRMAFFGLVILLAGMLGGAAITLATIGRSQWGGPPPVPVEEVVTRIIDGVAPRLHLSPEQVRQVQPILQKHMTRLHGIWADSREQIVEELRAMSGEIEPVLNENQQRLWQQYMQGLPGPFRRGGGPLHVGGGPGPGRGPGRAAGPGGRFGPRRGAPSEPNAAPAAPRGGPVRVN
ncbi:MAG: hypothetical protein JW955_05265 [Sedimentisphaerales bacterium]|nr:hypothetical protein [Sedimentisphaerales bacterium]